MANAAARRRSTSGSAGNMRGIPVQYWEDTETLFEKLLPIPFLNIRV